MGYRFSSQLSLHSFHLFASLFINCCFTVHYWFTVVLFLSRLVSFISVWVGPRGNEEKRTACGEQHEMEFFFLRRMEWNCCAARGPGPGHNPQSFIQINFLFSFIKNKVNFNLLCVDGIKKYYNSISRQSGIVHKDKAMRQLDLDLWEMNWLVAGPAHSAIQQFISICSSEWADWLNCECWRAAGPRP